MNSFYLTQNFIGLKFQKRIRIQDEILNEWEDIPGVLCGWDIINKAIYLHFYEEKEGVIRNDGGYVSFNMFRVHPEDRKKVFRTNKHKKVVNRFEMMDI